MRLRGGRGEGRPTTILIAGTLSSNGYDIGSLRKRFIDDQNQKRDTQAIDQATLEELWRCLQDQTGGGKAFVGGDNPNPIPDCQVAVGGGKTLEDEREQECEPPSTTDPCDAGTCTTWPCGSGMVTNTANFDKNADTALGGMARVGATRTRPIRTQVAGSPRHLQHSETWHFVCSSILIYMFGRRRLGHELLSSYRKPVVRAKHAWRGRQGQEQPSSRYVS